uniref:Tyrosine-protein phosphatase domain-containing protein n=1 Tax=Angiostrongylus cantonensis TaxID=6313 RepID=A0A0K0DG92_ANGCA
MPARATGRLRGTSPGKVSAQAEVNADTIADFVRTHSYRGHSHKNRCPSVVCYDENAVELKPNSKKEEKLDRENTYINANIVNSPQGNFILAQAPMANTLIEWYRMIWQLKISIVVCLIDPQEIPPSERYFALKEGNKLKIKNRFKISTTSVREHDGIIVNYELRVTNRRASSDKNRVVYVIVRPTKDDTPIEPRKQLNLIAEVWATETATSTFEENSETPPILVHSCNGVSRTAAFVATAMLCKSLETQGEMSPVEVWSRLNQVRHNAARECFHFISSIECALVYAFDIGLLTANINQLKDVNKVSTSSCPTLALACPLCYGLVGIKKCWRDVIAERWSDARVIVSSIR